MEFKKAIPRAISIEPTANGGFIVTTGCCVMSFGNAATLVEAMDQYLADPEGHEKRYNEMQTQEGTRAEQGGQGQPEPRRPEEHCNVGFGPPGLVAPGSD